MSLSACRFFYEEKAPKIVLNITDFTNTSYAIVKEKIFEPHCTECHGNKGGVNLETYANVKLNLNDIARTTVEQKTMPKNGALAKDEITLLSEWIKAGAPEFAKGEIPTPPPSTPPPETPKLEATYASIRENIFVPRCLKCHTAGSRAGKHYPLDTLEGILNSPEETVVPGDALSSSLYQVIALPDDDDDRMPPSGARLTEEEISTIKKWIDDGVN